MPVRHLLLDADGVLQRIAGGWRTTLERIFGDDVAQVMPDLEAAEGPALCGDAEFGQALARLLDERGVTAPAEQVYAELWLAVETDDDVLGLARDLRRGGLGVHVASNQHARRAAYMERELGYAGLFEHRFYSCDLGVAKPDPAYFETVLARLGAPADDVLFVDDNATNVAAARAVGLRAEQWALDDGHPALLALLAGHDLTWSAPGTP